MSFNVGLSGLNAASTDLNVTGNNIANVGTTGFKASRAEFADLYASSIMGSGGNSVGNGVVTADIAQQFTQGNISTTGNSLDLAISGNGYFVLDDGGSTVYSRAGAFKTDSEGYVVNSQGWSLQGYGIDADGEIVNGVISDILIETNNQEPSATSNMTQSIALDSTSELPEVTPFDTSDSDSYNWSTSVSLYDSQGNAHTMTQYFVKTGSNTWDMNVLIDGRNPADPTSTDPYTASLAFTSSGDLSTISSTDLTVNADNTFSFSDWIPAVVTDDSTDPVTWGSNGAADSVDGITIDVTNMTQTNTSFAVVASPVQDGYATGELSGLSIDEEGILFATYTNGQSKVVGQIVMANFTNSQGLTPVGDTAWAQTMASGEPAIGTPGAGTLGTLTAGALEDSNVDLTAELVSLIVAQRNYQANAKTIETESTIAQTTINLS